VGYELLSLKKVGSMTSFILTEHHAMEAYWRSGCIAPLIL